MEGLQFTDELLDQLADFPFRPPPPGVKADFKNRKFQGQPVLISAVVCFPFIIAFGLLRFYAKRRLLKKWGALEDYAFLAALVTGIAVMCMNISFTYSGAFGYHIWDVRIGDLDKSALLHSLLLPSLTALTLWIIKFSLFCLILSSFRPVTYLRRLCYIGIAVTLPVHLAGAVIYAVGCSPVPHTWTRPALLSGLARGTCVSPGGPVMTYNVAQGAFHVLTDFYLLIIPIPAIAKLHLPRKRKIQVLAVFASGFAACVMSVVALVYRIRCAREDDTIYLQIFVLTVTNIEMAVGIMIPCMGPAAKSCRYFYGRFHSKRLQSLNSSEGQGYPEKGASGQTPRNGTPPDEARNGTSEGPTLDWEDVDFPSVLHGPGGRGEAHGSLGRGDP